MYQGMGCELKTAMGQWLLMAGLDMVCRMPDDAIRKRFFGGLKLGAKKSQLTEVNTTK